MPSFAAALTCALSPSKARRKSSASSWPNRAAAIRQVRPVASPWLIKEGQLRSSACTTETSPWWMQARSSAVAPSSPRDVVSAPVARSRHTHCEAPRFAASNRGVSPSCCGSSQCTPGAVSAPNRAGRSSSAARPSGVQPRSDLSDGSAPAATRLSTMASRSRCRSRCTASMRGVTPQGPRVFTSGGMAAVLPAATAAKTGELRPPRTRKSSNSRSEQLGTSARCAAQCPPSRARSSAHRAFLFRRCRLAPAARSISQAEAWPFAAAWWSAVDTLSLQASTATPAEMRPPRSSVSPKAAASRSIAPKPHGASTRRSLYAHPGPTGWRSLPQTKSSGRSPSTRRTRASPPAPVGAPMQKRRASTARRQISCVESRTKTTVRAASHSLSPPPSGALPRRPSAV
mmetsp:Transcript_36355/g.120389  ORF Transcript_36355/g.120389 Transcript_36355/m.120389 type:complete len:401 (-) Transcript_36355:2753-3955(-)